MKPYLLQQYEYHVWANHRVCEHLRQLPEDVCRQQVTSVFPTIHDALTHLYVIDSGWLSLLAGGGMTVADMTPDYVEQLKTTAEQWIEQAQGKCVSEFDAMLLELGDRFKAFIAGHEDWEALCPFGAFQARYMDFIQHVVNHGTYHRGNIAAMLRQMGHPGTQTDYSFFLYTLQQ